VANDLANLIQGEKDVEKITETHREAEEKKAAPWGQVERLVMPVLGPCPICFGVIKPCRCQLEKEVDRLNCNNISCHQGRDILDSIFEACAQLPCNGIQGILCGAAQEIQALREKA
jgi:hypothetical protein